MTNEHPITPPPELVQEWVSEYASQRPEVPEQIYLATRAAQWGANQELEACCEWLKADGYPGTVIDLRAARRPKPPSLKEEATAAIVRLSKKYPGYEGADIETIRRAIEALPND
jgi:hypothetical protein